MEQTGPNDRISARPGPSLLGGGAGPTSSSVAAFPKESGLLCFGDLLYALSVHSTQESDILASHLSTLPPADNAKHGLLWQRPAALE